MPRASSGGGGEAQPRRRPRRRKRQEPSAVAVPRARGPWAGRPGCADRLRVSRPARRPAGDRNCGERQGPVAFDAGRAAQNMMLAVWNEGVVVRAESRTRRAWPSRSDSRRMSRATERVLVGHPARAVPRSAPLRGVSAEAVREAASLLESLGQQVQEVAIEVEEGYADNFIKVWIAQTGDEVTRTSGSAGASSTSTSSAARCTSSRARSRPRLPGRARLAAPLLAAADRDVGAARRAGHAHARQAG
jgi:hypothetical protein